MVVCSFAHSNSLDRLQPLYTAMTRGMELTILVGERRAISVARGTGQQSEQK